jgi:hypothetical protein
LRNRLPDGPLAFSDLCPAPISKYLRLLFQYPLAILLEIDVYSFNGRALRQTYYLVYHKISL